MRVAGTDVSLTVAGQTLKGDFAVTSAAGVVTIEAAKVSLSLGGTLLLSRS